MPGLRLVPGFWLAFYNQSSFLCFMLPSKDQSSLVLGSVGEIKYGWDFGLVKKMRKSIPGGGEAWIGASSWDWTKEKVSWVMLRTTNVSARLICRHIFGWKNGQVKLLSWEDKLGSGVWDVWQVWASQPDVQLSLWSRCEVLKPNT